MRLEADFEKKCGEKKVWQKYLPVLTLLLRGKLDNLIARLAVAFTRAVVVAQLVERSLPPPAICGLNPNIGKMLSTNCNRKDTKKRKRGWEWHIF